MNLSSDTEVRLLCWYIQSVQRGGGTARLWPFDLISENCETPGGTTFGTIDR
jgi:hypothetical protein